MERDVTDLTGAPMSNVAILGVTSLEDPHRDTATIIANTVCGH